MNAHAGNFLQGVLFQILALAVVALLAWFSTLHERRFDLTPSARHGLSAASLELLRQLPGTVTVEVYAGRLAQRQPAERFLDRYRQAGLNLDVRYVDPLARPERVRERGVERNGELVIDYRGGTEHVYANTGSRPGYSEQDFSFALQRLLRGRRALLQFLLGHGERKPLGGANHDLDTWAGLLRDRGYRIRVFDLSQETEVPDIDATLVWASPRIDLLPGERRLLSAYLRQGGNLLWLTEPGALHDDGMLAGILGVERPAGSILSTSVHPALAGDPGLVLAGPEHYLEHQALERFEYLTLFPESAPLRALPDSGWTAHALVQSSAASWLETGPLSGHVQYDPGIDLQGPLPLVLALERPYPGNAEGPRAEGPRARQRVVVTGDGDFLSNTYVRNGGNAELGLRLVDWLSMDVDASPFYAALAGPADTQLQMSPLGQEVFLFSFLFGLPLALLGAGWTVQRRRRKR